MIVQNIFKGRKDEINLRIRPSIENEFFSEQQKPVEVDINYEQGVYWIVFNDKSRIEIEGISPEDTSILERIASNNKVTLLVTAQKKKAEIKSILLTGVVAIPEGIEVGFSDIIIEDIDKRFFSKRGQKKHQDWLSEELIIQNKQKRKILLDNSPGESGFRIYGSTIAVDVKRNETKQYEIIRILKWSNRFNPTFVLTGDIKIKDISKTATLRTDTELKLNRISSTEKYIKTWEKYQNKEKENRLQEVNRRGFLTITKITRKSEKRYSLHYDINENTDNWLKIENGKYIDLNRKQVLPSFNSYENGNGEKIVCKIIDKQGSQLIVDIENENKPDDSAIYYANLSLLGDVIMNKRRTRSLEEIRNNATPMPVLPAVLEGVEYESIRRRHIKPITTKVKNEFGVFGPNEIQVHALDIALNSPDITIIQGPPGTGKTKVISALAKRLAEIYKDSGQAPEMNVLLTAFQHDAVENMVARTEVLGLPALKFSNTQHQSIDVIDKWIYKQTEKVEAKQNEIEPNDAELTYKDIISSYLEYVKSLDQEKAKNDLVLFRKANISILPDDIIDDIGNISRKEINTDDAIIEKVIDLVKNIRTEEVSYNDDGEINLRRLLKNYNRYQNSLPNIDCDFIEVVKKCLGSKRLTKDDFAKLNDIKLHLLDQLKSVGVGKKVKMANAKIESAYKKLIDFFSKDIQASGSIYSVLTEFQNDLNSNKDRIRETIQNYVALAASTVQGSKGKQILTIKPDPFDTVIVDEAARANPLDLLIPLTSAKRRIILVGDHRQLPHIIDDAIREDLEQEETAAKDVSKYLKDSLFERFYTILKNLRDKDGVQRVVTLNTQYRMHPRIGEFISRTFYEKYGDPKINSGTPAEKLNHNISQYKNKVAVSINIPNIKGGESKLHGSTCRPIEAKEAIRKAKEILDNDPAISVGIITFYSRQVTELFRQGTKLGVVEKNDNNDFVITKRYQKTQNGEERFRIGSVDAFQGKEFDVVILSLVRSNTIQIKNYKDIRIKYGFLTSYHRLNVSMSRAKKLLITIGDEEMFKIDAAKEHIYGLYAFYNELINSDYGLSI